MVLELVYVCRHGTWCVSDEQYIGTAIGKCMKNDFQGTYSDEYPMVKIGAGEMNLCRCCLSAHNTSWLAVTAT